MDPKAAFESIVDYIREHLPVCVAFSGGVDSSVVALAAFHASRKDSLAVTVSSELCPKTEIAEAEWVARSIGINHSIIKLDLLKHGSVAKNPPDRCYRCKTVIMSEIDKAVQGNSSTCILEGSNSDDADSHRPGMKALRELNILSPLMEIGIGKALVREIAGMHSLPNYNKPSSPCLATRFPYGVRLTKSKLRRVGMAEEYIRSLGFSDFRVRDHKDVARIEFLSGDIQRVISAGFDKKIVAKLTALGYNYVTLDLDGFKSGSMDLGAQG